MTALSEYQRLECSGLWREAPGAQRRDVLVAFGDATLILREMPSERALSHWSLPALIRTNPGRMPALFAPGPDSTEELEIDDEAMIAAISKVHTLIAARQPHPGRLRGALLAGVAAAILGVGLFWLPGALIRHTAEVLPASAEAEVGRAILADLQRLTGAPCSAPEGAEVLPRFASRLLGPDGQLVVLPGGMPGTLHLPGGMVILGAPLIRDQDSVDVAAVSVLAERLRAEAADPLPDALGYAGLGATLRLLTSGEVPAEVFHGYGERLLKVPPAPVSDAALIERAAARNVGTSAYARALDPGAGDSAALISADPFAMTPPAEPVLSDTDWVALQGLCG